MNALLYTLNRCGRTLGLTALLAIPMLSHAQTPLYEWGFDSGSGANTGTGTGGTLTTTGTASLGTTGGIEGGALNLSSNVYDNAGASGSGTTSTISSLGTLSQFTVTMWIKPDAVFSGTGFDNNFSRLITLGAATDGGVNTFRLSLHDAGGTFGTRFEVQIGGQAGTGTTQVGLNNAGLTGNDWVFVTLRYDGTTANVYYSAAMDAASTTANQNLSIFVGNASTAVSQFGQAGLNTGLPDYNISPGSVDLDGAGSVSNAYLGNNPAGTRGFDGYIDEVRVYSGILTDAQLDTIRLESVSAVPEPSTYAAIFGGVALAGVVIGRRRRNS